MIGNKLCIACITLLDKPFKFPTVDQCDYVGNCTNYAALIAKIYRNKCHIKIRTFLSIPLETAITHIAMIAKICTCPTFSLLLFAFFLKI